MGTTIGPLAVRRSTWIKAAPERVWEEFTTFERMKAWYGTGHQLVAFEPRLGGQVATDATGQHPEHGELKFGGRIIVWDPPREVTWEDDWSGHGWAAPALMTLRLTACMGGTVVELFHHGFERVGESPSDTLNGFEGGWDTRHLEALRRIVEA